MLLCVCVFVDDSGAAAWSILVEVKRLLSMTFGVKNDVISAYFDTGFSTIRLSYFLPGVENNRVMARVNLDSDKLGGPLDVNHTSGDARPGASEGESGVQITCFSEVVDDTTLHFQIIILHKQIYAWIGCSSSKLGHVYAAASTRPNNLVSVTSLLGGSSDNIGSGIARRLVLKTGLNIILACNIPKNSPMLEANAEKILIQKLISLGYNRSKAEGCS